MFLQDLAALKLKTGTTPASKPLLAILAKKGQSSNKSNSTEIWHRLYLVWQDETRAANPQTKKRPNSQRTCLQSKRVQCLGANQWIGISSAILVILTKLHGKSTFVPSAAASSQTLGTSCITMATCHLSTLCVSFMWAVVCICVDEATQNTTMAIVIY